MCCLIWFLFDTTPYPLPSSSSSSSEEMMIRSPNECEEEVVPDSDDERMLTTAVGISSVDMCSRALGHGLDLKMVKLSRLCEQENDFAPDSDDEHQSGGRSRRGFCPVRAHSSHVSSLAATSMTDKANELSRVEGKCSVLENVKEVTKGHDSKECSEGMIDKVDRCFARLDYAESQEPDESSQADALEFVDRFLSINNVGDTEGVDTRKTLKKNSSPVSSASGSRSLAKIINARSSTREKGPFEWDESHHDGGGDIFSKKMDGVFEGGSSSGNRCEEKKQFPNPFREIMGSTHTDSRFMLHSLKDSTEKNIIKGLDERLDAESSGQQMEANGIGRETDDVFDDVFNTQMAAEVMETLSFVAPANGTADDALRGRLNTVESSLSGATKEKDHLEHLSFTRNACSAPEVIARNSKRVKLADGNLSKQTSSSSKARSKLQKELNLELTIRRNGKRAKSFAENDVNCRNFAYTSKSSGRKSTKPIKKGEKSVVRDSTKELEQNLNAFISVEQPLLGEGQSEGVCRTVSTIAHPTRQVTRLSSLKSTEIAPHNSRESTSNAKYFGITYKRKRSCALSIRGTSPKFGPNTSGEGGSSRQTQEEVRCSRQTQEEVRSLSKPISTSFLKLDIWSYPRRKRTHRNAPGRLNGASNLYAPFTAIDRKEGIGHSSSSLKRSRSSVTPKYINFNMEIITWSSVHAYPLRESAENTFEGSLLRQNIDKSGSAAVSNTVSTALNKQMYPLDPVKVDASVQSGKVDIAESISSADGAEKDLKVEVLSNVEVKQRGLECTTSLNCAKGSNVAPPSYKGYGYHKQPCHKNRPRSTLIKELIQLGVPELIPNFSSKDLRRRRDMENIRVLFSQHLDDSMIKHQKKILRRLGISIASCSMESTHFIIDQFVRTRNMLEAIALGKPVVTHLWLESCGEARCYIDEKEYIMRDAKKEKDIGFSMPVSLARAREQPLLKGHKVLVTPNVRPDKEMIASLVKAVQGQVVEIIHKSVMDEKISDDVLILSCEEDHPICVPFLDKGATAYSTELLLNGIVIQKLEYARHQLFTKNAKKNCSSLCSRKKGNLSCPVPKQN